MRFIKIVAFGVIGLLPGIGWFQLDTSGYFERWEKLPNAPAEVLGLFPTIGFIFGLLTSLLINRRAPNRE